MASGNAALAVAASHEAYVPLAGMITTPGGTQMLTGLTLTAVQAGTQGTVQFIAADGQAKTVSFSLNKAGAAVQIAADSAASFSAKVSANAPVAGIAETVTGAAARREAPETGYTAAASEFRTEPSGTAARRKFIPLLLRNANTLTGLANSTVVVQNASAAKNSVTLSYPKLGKVTKFDLQPGSFRIVRIKDEAGIPDGWNGSAVVEGTGGVAATILQFNGSPDSAVQSFEAIAESKPKWQIAFFSSRLQNGLNTVVSAMNTSDRDFAAGELTILCKSTQGSGNFVLANETPVRRNESYYFNPATDMRFPAEWYGGCTVQNTKSSGISVFVQMRFISNGPGHAAAYHGIPNPDPAKISPYYLAVVPKVAKKETWNPADYATSITVKNLRTAAGKLFFQYVGAAGFADASIKADLPPDGTLIHNHRLASGISNSLPLKDGWKGALMIWSTVPIGVISQLQYKAVGVDSYMATLAPTFEMSTVPVDLPKPDVQNPFEGIPGLSIGNCQLSQAEIEAIRLIFLDPRQTRKKMACNATLQQAALNKGRDMTKRNYFGHTDPDGFGPNYFLRKLGYPLPSFCGKANNSNNVESLGGGYNGAQDIYEGWGASPSHATHVLGLNDFFKEQWEFGISRYDSSADKSTYNPYWVMVTAYPE